MGLGGGLSAELERLFTRQRAAQNAPAMSGLFGTQVGTQEEPKYANMKPVKAPAVRGQDDSGEEGDTPPGPFRYPRGRDARKREHRARQGN